MMFKVADRVLHLLGVSLGIGKTDLSIKSDIGEVKGKLEKLRSEKR